MNKDNLIVLFNKYPRFYEVCLDSVDWNVIKEKIYEDDDGCIADEMLKNYKDYEIQKMLVDTKDYIGLDMGR